MRKPFGWLLVDFQTKHIDKLVKHLSDQGTFTAVGAQGGFLGTQP